MFLMFLLLKKKICIEKMKMRVCKDRKGYKKAAACLKKTFFE